MKKKASILIVVLLGIGFIYFGCNYYLSMPLPEKFEQYTYLSEGSLESDSYELVKIIDGWKGEAIVNGIIHVEEIFYDLETKTTLFITTVKEYDKVENTWEDNAPYTIYWKVNAAGRLLDSVRLDASLGLLHNTGVFFSNDYFIDWVNTGDKTKKEYLSKINDDSLTILKIGNRIKEADLAVASKDYDAEITNILLKEGAGWTMIHSKKLYDKTKGSFGWITMPVIENLIKSDVERFIELEYARNSNDPITIEYFVKHKKHSKNAFDFNNTSRSGWDGMGYFRISHNSESITYKDYGFNNNTDKTMVYYPISNKPEFVILINRKRANDQRRFQDTGVFIVRKK